MRKELFISICLGVGLCSSFTPTRIGRRRPLGETLRVPTTFRAKDELMETTDVGRRNCIYQLATIANGLVGFIPLPASAKSRTEGYPVQKTEQEWQAILSPMQYQVLRKGTDEPLGYSILEAEFRPGLYKCAACGTPLFESSEKFVSGTGFCSFAAGLPGVEVDHSLNTFQENLSLSGTELRCATCGGHIGDAFHDGFMFAGTDATHTGLRFSVDGAALVFFPTIGDPVRGDTPEPPGTLSPLPEWLEPPLHHHHDHSDSNHAGTPTGSNP